jgi:hypothetical protein
MREASIIELLFRSRDVDFWERSPLSKKDGAPECKTLFEHGVIVKAQCWDANGLEMSEGDALKMSRDELKADEEWFEQMDEWIERSLHDKLKSVGAAAAQPAFGTDGADEPGRP